MRYYIVTDLYDYVQVIKHTGTKMDYIELNLDDYDLSEDRIHAYKVGKNELIFDEEKYQQILQEKQSVADEKEISELKKRLNETDYIMAEAFEEVLTLSNPLTFVSDFIKILVKYSTQYKDTLADRKQWRNRIKELEGE